MARPLTLFPRQPRIDARLPALLIASDGGEVEVVVMDLSSGGFRLRGKEDIDIGEAIFVGEHVHLRVARHGDYPAEIKWTLGTEAGGVFLEEVGDLDA